MTSRASNGQAGRPVPSGTKRRRPASGTYVGTARTLARPRVLLVAPEGGANDLYALLQRIGCAVKHWTGGSRLAKIAAHYALVVLALGLSADDIASWCDEVRNASSSTRIVLFAERGGVLPVLHAGPDEVIQSSDAPELVEWRLQRNCPT